MYFLLSRPPSLPPSLPRAVYLTALSFLPSSLPSPRSKPLARWVLWVCRCPRSTEGQGWTTWLMPSRLKSSAAVARPRGYVLPSLPPSLPSPLPSFLPSSTASLFFVACRVLLTYSVIPPSRPPSRPPSLPPSLPQVIASVNNSLYCGPIEAFGTEAQKKEWSVQIIPRFLYPSFPPSLQPSLPPSPPPSVGWPPTPLVPRSVALVCRSRGMGAMPALPPPRQHYTEMSTFLTAARPGLPTPTRRARPSSLPPLIKA